MRVAALLVTPVAPHFAEHIWSGILKNTDSVQNALWPTPNTAVDPATLEALTYMRGTVKTIRDAEGSLIKLASKAKSKKGNAADVAMPYDPKKPKSVRIYVATSFPEWQDICVQAIQDAYNEKDNTVDDAKVREVLTQKGLIKDKKAMPFVQAFKKRMQQFGAQTAFRRALPFNERDVLFEMLPYLKKTLGLVDAEVYLVDEARQREGESGFTKSIIDSSEPGNPGFEYHNV